MPESEIAPVDHYAGLVTSVLLMEARMSFTSAIKAALLEGGYDDMPKAGARVIGRIAYGGTSVSEVATAYGVSRQAGSQLVDTLVARGYVRRDLDEEDRRRTILALTERGQGAAEAIAGAIDRIDGAWIDAVGADRMYDTRRALAELALVRHREAGDPRVAGD